MPIVYFDTYIEGSTPFIGTNNSKSVATIVDYLCRSGEPPAYFDSPHVNHNSAERLQGYLSAMTALGLDPVVFGDAKSYNWDFERLGYEQADAMIAAGRLPGKTILCANDRLAFGVMAAAYSRGLRVGRRSDCDLRLAAHDDHPLSRYTCPPLTTMAQDFAAMASGSVKTLLSMLDESEAPSKARKVSLDATLVMRQSA
jgi:DNA-binding LacI/PurR family transcriptional regulator